MGCMLSFSFLFMMIVYSYPSFLSMCFLYMFLTGTFEDDPVDEDDRSAAPSGAGFEDPSA